MKTFKNCAAQGDMLLRRIENLPEGVKPINAENGNYVLAHSETGHHHVVRADHTVKFYAHANDNLKAYLVVDNTVEAVHMRRDHTHETIKIDKGIYEVIRQREYIADGFRRAQD